MFSGGQSDAPKSLNEAGLVESAAERTAEARERKIAELRGYLAGYLELGPDQDAESIRFEQAGGLGGEYGDQYRFLDDERLAGTEIAVVPDKLWVKGKQPSESHAAKGLILIREGYYLDPAKREQDEPAWMAHELAHCQRFIDKRDNYDEESQQVAFDDIGLDAYPNNQVEERTFGKQFEYLRSKGVGRERVAEMMNEHYGPEDFKFLDRVLDRVYGQP